MEVLMIANYTNVPGEDGNNRFNYLIDLLTQRNVNVELVTSIFFHQEKKIRDMNQIRAKLDNYKLTMLNEPGYSKNVSFKRFYSHYLLGKNLKRYLNTRKRPDIIYCAVPSLDFAYIAAQYAKRNNIRFIIDVQDLWPEGFKMVFNVPLISNMVFYPMKKQADYIYGNADEIITVSQTYADRASKVSGKCKEAHSIFLGTELAFFDRMAEENKLMIKPKDEIWLAYIGTLGHSYDLTCVIDALKILQEKGIKNIKFVVMGDGPSKSKFQEYAKNQDIYASFTGRLDYGKMVGILTGCDMAVNPISKGAAQSIINKHADYAASGLPVLNTQECQEYRDLIKKYEAGFNCENNNAADLAEKLLKLYENESLRKTMGKNSRRMADEKFDRLVTYQEILSIIKNDFL